MQKVVLKCLVASALCGCVATRGGSEPAQTGPDEPLNWRSKDEVKPRICAEPLSVVAGEQPGIVSVDSEQMSGEDAEDQAVQLLVACQRSWMQAQGSERPKAEYDLRVGEHATVADISPLLSAAVRAGYTKPTLRSSDRELSFTAVASPIAEAKQAQRDAERAAEEQGEEAPAFAFSAPKKLLFIRLGSQEAELIGLDQAAKDPVVKMQTVDVSGGVAAVVKALTPICKDKALTCDRVTLELPPTMPFVDGARAIGAIMDSRGSSAEPLELELRTLNQLKMAVELASEAVGAPIGFGDLPDEDIDNVIRANFATMTACYAKGLQKDPNLAGKVISRFVITAEGKVRHITNVQSGDLAAEAGDDPQLREAAESLADLPFVTDSAVLDCVQAAFRKMSFPAPVGGSVRVVYPLRFAQQDQ